MAPLHAHAPLPLRGAEPWKRFDGSAGARFWRCRAARSVARLSRCGILGMTLVLRLFARLPTARETVSSLSMRLNTGIDAARASQESARMRGRRCAARRRDMTAAGPRSSRSSSTTPSTPVSLRISPRGDWLSRRLRMSAAASLGAADPAAAAVSSFVESSTGSTLFSAVVSTMVIFSARCTVRKAALRARG